MAILSLDKKILWEPQSGPQTALITCPIFEVCFGGARGGGKTEASLGDWMEHQATWGENAVGIFFRRSRLQLSEVIARAKFLFKQLGAKYNENKSEFLFPNGARLKFAYLERDSDAENYQGHSYTRVYIEEATNFPSPSPINKLRATLRSAAGVPCGMRLTCNPGGAGHNWVKARYITPAPQGYVPITETEEIEFDGIKLTVSLTRVFIPSKLRDNALLMRNDPTYILRLKQAGNENLVKAWLDGNWDVIDGAFFSGWDVGTHILDHQEWKRAIPSHALRFRAFDWGGSKPFSVGWYALSDGKWDCPAGRRIPAGAIVKYREWYGASGPNVGLKMLNENIAKGIKERERGEKITYGVADPAIFIRQGGPSIAETMSIYGVDWQRADNKRTAGWAQMQSRLGGNGVDPMLYFFDTCLDSIRTIPTLQHSETNPEDVDTDGEDHAGDETRYACMSRPWFPAAEPDPPPPLKEGEFRIMDIINKHRINRVENYNVG